MEVLSVSLNNRLDVDFRHELVSYDVSLPQGKVHAGDHLYAEAGGKRAPAQFSAASTHEDGSVREAKIYFFVDLPANGGADVSICKGKEPESGLKVTREEARVLVENGIWTAAFPLFSGEAREPGAIPAPLLWVLANTKERLTGEMRSLADSKPLHLATEITASGPLFARLKQVYSAEGARYSVEFEVREKEPGILLTEQMSGRLGLEWRIYPGDDLTCGHWCPHTRSEEKSTSPPQGQPGGDQEVYVLPATCRKPVTVVPYHSWWQDEGSWWGTFSPEKDVSDYVGLFAVEPTRWEPPDRNLLTVHREDERTWIRAVPDEEGQRKWGIIVGEKEELGPYAPSGEIAGFRAQVRYSQMPLDRIKDQRLHWPGCGEGYRAHLLMGEDEIEGARKRLLQNDFVKGRLAEIEDYPALQDAAGLYLVTGQNRYAEEARKEIEEELQDWVSSFMAKGYYVDKNKCIGMTRSVRGLALRYDCVAGSEAFSKKERESIEAKFAFLAHQLFDPEFWPADMGNFGMRDDICEPEEKSGYQMGCINFHSDYYTCLLAAAMVLEKHPMREQWARYAEREIEKELITTMFPSGVWKEAPNYHLGTLLYLVPAMKMLKINGFCDFSRNENFKKTMDYLCEIQTPRDARLGICLLPTVGDTTFSFHSQSMQNIFAWAASLCREDEAFSARMMRAWHRAGRIVFGAHDRMMLGSCWYPALAFVDENIRPAEEGPRDSIALPGYGALLRAEDEDQRETYLLLKMGDAAEHYDPDEGSIHVYAHGEPLILDYGCMYDPSNDQPWYHNRISVDHKIEPGWDRGSLTAFAASPVADYVEGEVLIEKLREQTEIPGTQEGHQYRTEPFEHINPVLWRRKILFDRRNHSFLLVDELDGEQKADWSLHVLAERVSVQGDWVRFRGQRGVDLDVFVPDINAFRVETGSWSYGFGESKYGDQVSRWKELSDLPVEVRGERQYFLRLFAEPGKDFRALLLPHRAGMAPAQAEKLDAAGAVAVKNGRDRSLFFCFPRLSSYEQDGIKFRGEAGIIVESPGSTAATIFKGKYIECPAFLLMADGMTSVQLTGESIRGTSMGPSKMVTLVLYDCAARQYSLLVGEQRRDCVCLPRPQNRLKLAFHLPEGKSSFRLVPQ